MLIKTLGLVVVAALVAGAAVRGAGAEELQANVVAWSPNDVRSLEPVSVIFRLYTSAGSQYPQDGKPVAGVDDVEVVIRGGGPARRFASEDIGGGRYRTEIVFPDEGAWHLRVRYGARSQNPADEIPLGKGSICVGAPLCGPAALDARQNVVAPDGEDGRAWAAPAAGAVAVAIALAISGAWFRRRLARGRRETLAT